MIEDAVMFGRTLPNTRPVWLRLAQTCCLDHGVRPSDMVRHSMMCVQYASCDPSAVSCGCSSPIVPLNSKLQPNCNTTPQNHHLRYSNRHHIPLLFFLCPQQNIKPRLKSNPMWLCPTKTTNRHYRHMPKFLPPTVTVLGRSQDLLDTLLQSHQSVL